MVIIAHKRDVHTAFAVLKDPVALDGIHVLAFVHEHPCAGDGLDGAIAHAANRAQQDIGKVHAVVSQHCGFVGMENCLDALVFEDMAVHLCLAKVDLLDDLFVCELGRNGFPCTLENHGPFAVADEARHLSIGAASFLLQTQRVEGAHC